MKFSARELGGASAIRGPSILHLSGSSRAFFLFGRDLIPIKLKPTSEEVIPKESFLYNLTVHRRDASILVYQNHLWHTYIYGGIPLTNSSLSGGIYQILKKRILSLELLPGEKLQERALAESLSVSRTPVREALHRLSTEGWILVNSRKNIQVRTVSHKDVLDIFQLRRLIELQAVELLCEDYMTREISQKLSEITNEMAEARNDRPLFIGFDQDFHALIIDSLGNGKLSRIWKNLIEEIIWLGMIALQSNQRFEEVLDEHSRILDALKRRKKRLAREMALRHLEITEEIVLEKFSLRIRDLESR